MGSEKRNKMKKKEIILVIIILAICILSFLFFRLNDNTGTVAEIYYNGELVKEINLNKEEYKTIAVDDKDKIHVEIHDSKIRFKDVDCPDKLCEQEGFLYKEGDIAICMPNRCYIKIVSD